MDFNLQSLVCKEKRSKSKIQKIITKLNNNVKLFKHFEITNYILDENNENFEEH